MPEARRIRHKSRGPFLFCETKMTIRETPQRKEKKNKMTFGEALKKMEAGAFVAREGWNGQNQFIYLVEGSIPTVQDFRGRSRAAVNYARRTRPLAIDPLTNQEVVPIPPHIDMFTERGTLVCWFASQTDMTATDWYVRDYAQNNQEAGE